MTVSPAARFARLLVMLGVGGGGRRTKEMVNTV